MDADKPACWEVKRDHFGKKAQLAEAYFDETRTGAHCDSNWCDSPQEDPQKRIPIGRVPIWDQWQPKHPRHIRYEGNPNWELGDPDVPLPPYFTAAAPAVLGWDERDPNLRDPNPRTETTRPETTCA